MTHIGHVGNTHIAQMADVTLTRTCYNVRCTYRCYKTIPAWVVEPTVAKERYRSVLPTFHRMGSARTLPVKSWCSVTNRKNLAPAPFTCFVPASGSPFAAYRSSLRATGLQVLSVG